MLSELFFRADLDERDIYDFAQGIGAVVQNVPLKTFPKRKHWHLRCPGQSGTMEITWCPDSKRFWGEVRGNRAGKWTAEAMGDLESSFSKPA